MGDAAVECQPGDGLPLGETVPGRRTDQCAVAEFLRPKARYAANGAGDRGDRVPPFQGVLCHPSQTDQDPVLARGCSRLQGERAGTTLDPAPWPLAGSEGSGKNLPFSSLSEDLKKKEEEKE